MIHPVNNIAATLEMLGQKRLSFGNWIVTLCLVNLLCAGSTNAQESRVINGGYPGDTTVDLIVRMPSFYEENLDWAVVMIGTNDMINARKMISYESFMTNLEHIVEGFKKRAVQVALVSPPPVDTVYLLERHDRSSFTELPNTKLDSVQRMMHSLADEMGVYFVDVYRGFRKRNLPLHNSDSMIQNEKTVAFPMEST